MEFEVIFKTSLIIGIILQIIFAVVFANIAGEKGYNTVNYLIAGLFFGILVYIMVAALRDKTLESKVDELNKALCEGKQTTNSEIIDELPEL